MLGKVTNLNKHLKQHKLSIDWYTMYCNRNGKKSKNYLSDKMLNLVKYIISSNASLNELENSFLRNLVIDELTLASTRTFKHDFLPQIMKKLKSAIEEKLNEAIYITLIPDGWTSLNRTEFLGKTFIFVIVKASSLKIYNLGLGAQLADMFFETEKVTLGFEEIIGGHTSENIKKAIQNIINMYKFDKSKIKGKQ